MGRVRGSHGVRGTEPSPEIRNGARSAARQGSRVCQIAQMASHSGHMQQGCLSKKATWSPQHEPRLIGSSSCPVPRSFPLCSFPPCERRDHQRRTTSSTARCSGVRWIFVVPPMRRCLSFVVAVQMRYCRNCQPVWQQCRPAQVPPARPARHCTG